MSSTRPSRPPARTARVGCGAEKGRYLLTARSSSKKMWQSRVSVQSGLAGLEYPCDAEVRPCCVHHLRKRASASSDITNENYRIRQRRSRAAPPPPPPAGMCSRHWGDLYFLCPFLVYIRRRRRRRVVAPCRQQQQPWNAVGRELLMQTSWFLASAVRR
jgi:hypothetical protein